MRKLFLSLFGLILIQAITAQNNPAPLLNTDTLDAINTKFYDYFYEVDKTTNLANLAVEKKLEFIEKAFVDYGYSYQETLKAFVAKVDENPAAYGNMNYVWGIIVIPFENLDNNTIKAKFKPELAELMIKINAMKK